MPRTAKSPPSNSAQPSAKPAPLEPPGVDLEYLPGDVDGVMHIDVAALRAAALWQRHRASVSRMLVPGFDDCGYDPMTTLTTIDIGFAGAERRYIVFRGIDRAEATRCLESAKPGTVSFDGELATITHEGRHPRLATFVDSTTWLVLGAEQPSKAALLDAVRAGAALADNAGLAAAMREVTRTGAPMWLVSRPDSKDVEASLGVPGANITRMHATLRVTDRLDVQVVMVTKAPAAAHELVKTLESQRPSLKTIFDRVDARSLDETVTYDIGMTDAQVASMMSMVGFGI